MLLTLLLMVNYKKGLTEVISTGVNSIMFEFNCVVNETSRIEKALESGDLTAIVDGEWKGQVEELTTSLSGTVSSLLNTMENINDSSESISTALTETIWIAQL